MYRAYTSPNPTLHIKRFSVPPHSPDIKYSVLDRQRWHVTHELHAVAYADDWPPTVKLIPRAPIPNPSSFVSAPFRAPVVCRWHASAHTSPSRTSVVKHFDFAQFDDFSPHRARRVRFESIAAKTDNVSPPTRRILIIVRLARSRDRQTSPASFFRQPLFRCTDYSTPFRSRRSG